MARNLEKLKELAKDAYYSDGEVEENEDESGMDANKSSDRNAQKRQEDEDREVRWQRRREGKEGKGKYSTDDLLNIVLYFSQNSNNQAVAQTKELRKSCNDEKVQNLFEQVS